MQDRLDETILRVYDAASDDALWSDVLQQIADQIDAVGCIVFAWDRAGPDPELSASVASSYYDPAAIATYIDKCFEHECRDQDVFERHSLQADQIDLIDDSVLAPTLDALRSRPNVVVLQKLGILHRAAGLLNKDNPAQARFSVQLGSGRGRFTQAERDYLAGVLPHVAKAMDLGQATRQLARLNKSLISAYDSLSIGVCILDGHGRSVAANQEFQRQLDAYPAVKVLPDGVLRFAKPADQRRFEELRAHHANHGRFGARPRKEAISTGAGTFLCLELVPLDHARDIGTHRFGGFVLYSTDTSRPLRCDTSAIQHVYGLSATEGELIVAIAEGLTNTQIAARRGRSVATVNTQVKSILSKTQCATRTQLVRLMMSFDADYLLNTDGSPSR